MGKYQTFGIVGDICFFSFSTWIMMDSSTLCAVFLCFWWLFLGHTYEQLGNCSNFWYDLAYDIDGYLLKGFLVLDQFHDSEIAFWMKMQGSEESDMSSYVDEVQVFFWTVTWPVLKLFYYFVMAFTPLDIFFFELFYGV